MNVYEIRCLLVSSFFFLINIEFWHSGMICVLIWVFLFIVIWAPYLKRLKDKIFRTKGMLNMIPMELITKNENLKQLFLAGDILQGVK